MNLIFRTVALSLLALAMFSCGRRVPVLTAAPPVNPSGPPRNPSLESLACEASAPFPETSVFVDESNQLISNFTYPALHFLVRIRRGKTPVAQGAIFDTRSTTGGLVVADTPQTGNNGDITASIRATALGTHSIDFVVTDASGEKAQCSASIKVVGKRPDPLQVALLVDGNATGVTIPNNQTVMLSVVAPQARSCELFKNGASQGSISTANGQRTAPHNNPGSAAVNVQYTVLCVADNSPATQTASVRVTVNPPPTGSLVVLAEPIGRRNELTFIRPTTPVRLQWQSSYAVSCILQSNGVPVLIPTNGFQDFLFPDGALDITLECFDGHQGIAGTQAHLRPPPVPSVHINGLPGTVSKLSLPETVTISWNGSGSDSCELNKPRATGVTGSVNLSREAINSSAVFEVQCTTAGLITQASASLSVDCINNEIVSLKKLSHFMDAKTLPVRNGSGALPTWTTKGWYESFGLNWADGQENTTPAIAGLIYGDALTITSISGTGEYIANVPYYFKACTEAPFHGPGTISSVQFVGSNGRPVSVLAPLPKYYSRSDVGHFRIDPVASLLNKKYPVPTGAVAAHTSFVDTTYRDNARGCTYDFAVYGCRPNLY